MSKTYLLQKQKQGGDALAWSLEIDGRIARLRCGEKLLKTINLVAEPRRIQIREAELVIDVASFVVEAAMLAEIAATVQMAGASPAEEIIAAEPVVTKDSRATSRRRRPWWKKQITISRVLWVVLLVVIAAVIFGAYRDLAQWVGWQKPDVADKPPEPSDFHMAAIGIVGPVALWEDPALQERVKGQLSTGARITVTPTSRGRVVRALTKKGEEGYLPRYAVCSIGEYERRKAQNEIPKQVFCIVAEGSQGAVLPLGAPPGEAGAERKRPLFAAGDGIWLDESMRGREYYIGAESVHGDPAVMFLVLPTGKLARLDVW